MIDLTIMKKIQEAQQFIANGDRREAINAIDQLAARFSQASPKMNTIERLSMIGGMADLYSQVGEAAKEIPLWEQLCGLAENDLIRLGVMASSEDLLRTGFDFLRLGRAYRRQGRTSDAKRRFEQAAGPLRELGISINVDQLLRCDKTVFVGEHNGQRLFVT